MSVMEDALHTADTTTTTTTATPSNDADHSIVSDDKELIDDCGGKCMNSDKVESIDKDIKSDLVKECLSLNDVQRRVKVYMLTSESNWTDIGTGHVVYRLRPNVPPLLLVFSEVDNSVLLESEVLSGKRYQRQQTTLIVWSDASGLDLALSFQEAEGCEALWNELCLAQNIDFCYGPNGEHGDDRNGDEEYKIADLDENFDAMVNEPLELPPCEIGHLQSIYELVELVPKYRRQRLIVALLEDKYLNKLLDLFTMCEDLEDVQSLHVLFLIIKGLFLLHEHSIFEELFADENIMTVIGILEYDPGLSSRQYHRDFLENTARFKAIAPFKDPAIVASIHRTYRVSYIKDVILPRILDDATFLTLNSFVYFHHVDIINSISKDVGFLTALFNFLNDSAVEYERRHDCMQFLDEITLLAKALDTTDRSNIFDSLTELGLINLFASNMMDPNVAMRRYTLGVMSHLLQHDPWILRSYILCEAKAVSIMPEKASQASLLHVLTQRFCEEEDDGLHGQLSEFLKGLFDVNVSMPFNGISLVDSNQRSSENFLNLVYGQDGISQLVKPIYDFDIANPTVSSLFRCEAAVDLLVFFIRDHTYHIKNYVLRNEIISHVLRLLDSNHVTLSLTAVRLFRAVIGRADEFYYRYIIKHRLFDPIICALIKNTRYNLLNSAIIDVFQFVVTENATEIIKHIVECFGDVVKDIDYVPTFPALLTKYEAVLDQEFTGEAMKINNLRQCDGSMDEEEQAYFESGDEKCPDLVGVGECSIFDNISPTLGSSPTEGVSKENDAPTTAYRSSEDSDESAIQNVLSLRRRPADEDDDDFTVNTRRVRPRHSSSSSNSSIGSIRCLPLRLLTTGSNCEKNDNGDSISVPALSTGIVSDYDDEDDNENENDNGNDKGKTE